MALVHGAQEPLGVRDGLVLYLDAANKRSYPGIGTSWVDRSGNGNNGTLVGGVGYNSANFGSLVFDGTDDYSNHPYSSLLNLGTQFTISSFIKINAFSSNNPVFSTADVNFNVTTQGYFLYHNNQSGFGMDANALRLQFGQSAWRWNVYSSNGLTITDTNWHFVSVTASALNTNNPSITFYIDGNNITATYWSVATKGAINYSSSINSPRVASIYFPSKPDYDGPFYGNLNMGILQLYNRALTAAEVSQNFNALRGRYSI